MNDVAREAGVSQTTVSFVLNNIEAGLPDRTKQRVLEAARRLNYTPNDAARRLASKRSRALGLAIYDITDITDYQQAASSVVASVFRATETRGYRLSIYTTHQRAEGGEDIKTYFAVPVLSHEVEGVVVWDYYVESERLLASFRDGLPVVALDRQVDDVPCVVPDYDHGLRQVVRALVAKGRRRLGLLVRSDRAFRDVRVRAAFEQAAREAGLADSDLTFREERRPVAREEDTTSRCVDEFLASSRPPEAIVCGYDRTALSALAHLRSRGVKVPDDIAVVGCAGMPVTSHSAFRLSTLDLRIDQMGMHAVDLVLRMTKGEPLAGTCVMVQPQFIERETS